MLTLPSSSEFSLPPAVANQDQVAPPCGKWTQGPTVTYQYGSSVFYFCILAD